MLRPFEFCEPTSVAEASGLLARHGENARIYAGGTELLLAMKMGLLQYEHLVSIKGISSLAGIRFDDGAKALRIGGATRHRSWQDWRRIRDLECAWRFWTRSWTRWATRRWSGFARLPGECGRPCWPSSRC